MDKDKIIKWADDFIDEYSAVSDANIMEYSSEIENDRDSLETECEKKRKEIRTLVYGGIDNAGT